LIDRQIKTIYFTINIYALTRIFKNSCRKFYRL